MICFKYVTILFFFLKEKVFLVLQDSSGSKLFTFQTEGSEFNPQNTLCLFTCFLLKDWAWCHRLVISMMEGADMNGFLGLTASQSSLLAKLQVWFFWWMNLGS